MESQVQSLYDSQHNTQLELDRLHSEGCIADNLEPLKCFKCGSASFKDRTTATDSGYTTEIERWCAECDQLNGHWAYGAWQV